MACVTQSVLEIIVDHWPFSNQFDQIHLQWNSHQNNLQGIKGATYALVEAA